MLSSSASGPTCFATCCRHQRRQPRRHRPGKGTAHCPFLEGSRQHPANRCHGGSAAMPRQVVRLWRLRPHRPPRAIPPRWRPRMVAIMSFDIRVAAPKLGTAGRSHVESGHGLDEVVETGTSPHPQPRGPWSTSNSVSASEFTLPRHSSDLQPRSRPASRPRTAWQRRMSPTSNGRPWTTPLDERTEALVTSWIHEGSVPIRQPARPRTTAPPASLASSSSRRPAASSFSRRLHPADSITR